MFDWVEKLNGIKHSCRHIFGKQLLCSITEPKLTQSLHSIQFNLLDS